MKPFTALIAAGIASLVIFPATPQTTFAADADAAYRDIEETYGTVPGFFRLFPEEGVVEAWGAFKALQMNPEVGLDAKTRELIGMALASQGGCDTCVYFHAAAAFANGALEPEIVAAATIGLATRRLHKSLEQAGSETGAFKRETDLVLWGDPQTVQLRGPSFDLSRLQLQW